MVQKGNSVDAYIQGDLVGSNISNSSSYVEFDIDKTYDVYFVGQTYGYGIGLGSASVGTYPDTSLTQHNTGADLSQQPWFVGSTVKVSGGTVTTIQNATSVASQNVAVNVPNVTLGGFQTNFAGEPVTVQGMTFAYSVNNGSGYMSNGGSTAGSNPITLISIVDQNGSVVAGPVDATYTGSNGQGTVTFSNSVTLPVGTETYTLKGKLPSDMPNGTSIQFNVYPTSGSSDGITVDDSVVGPAGSDNGQYDFAWRSTLHAHNHDGARCLARGICFPDTGFAVDRSGRSEHHLCEHSVGCLAVR